MSLIRPNRIGRRWIGQPISTPRALFNNAENGVFWDFSDPRSLYTDASGTIPVSAPDTAIRLAADKSRTRSPITAYAGVQASTGLAPRYGRAPKSRRNLLSKTRAWSGAPWSITNSGTGVAPVVTDNAELAPDGTMRATRIVLNKGAGTSTGDYVSIGQSVSLSSGGKYAAGIWLRTTDGSTKQIQMRDDGATSYNPIIVTVTPIWQRFTSTGTAVASSGSLKLWLRGGQGTSDSASLAAFDPQLEAGLAPTAPQVVDTAYDMTEAGVPSFGFARFDLVDDALAAVMTLAQTGDVLLFGRGGSWIEPGRVFAAASNFQVGVTGTSITPGILRALGDLVGIVAIGRTLSADERNRALRYFQAAGAAGWLTLGPNLWADSGHTVTSAAWTNNGDGTFTASGGTGLLGFVPGSTIIGRQYLGKLEVVSRTSGGVYLPYDGNGANTIGIAAVGTFQHVFTAIGTVGPYIYSNGFTGTVRAVSYQLITPGA